MDTSTVNLDSDLKRPREHDCITGRIAGGQFHDPRCLVRMRSRPAKCISCKTLQKAEEQLSATNNMCGAYGEQRFCFRSGRLPRLRIVQDEHGRKDVRAMHGMFLGHEVAVRHLLTQCLSEMTP